MTWSRGRPWLDYTWNAPVVVAAGRSVRTCRRRRVPQNPALLTLVTRLPPDGALVALGRATADPAGRSTALDDAGGASVLACFAVAGTLLTLGAGVPIALGGGAVTATSCAPPGARRAPKIHHTPAPAATATAIPPAIHAP